MKQKLLVLLFILLFILGLFVSCANPHADTFAQYVSENDELIDSIVQCKTYTNIEKECVLLELFQAVGFTDDEACDMVDGLMLKVNQTANQTQTGASNEK